MRMRYFILAVLFPAAVWAQDMGLMQPPTPQPSQTLPALPQAAQPQPVAPTSAFPALPPSRACTKDDLLGVWKLADVYEEPDTGQVSAFHAAPFQYIVFNDDSTFSRYNSDHEMTEDEVRTQVHNETSLQQYVLDTSGLLFFYVNSIANDTQACFIVATARESFFEGEMLLMPPEGQIKGRLVRAYSKISASPLQAPPKKHPRRRGRRRGRR